MKYFSLKLINVYLDDPKLFVMRESQYLKEKCHI